MSPKGNTLRSVNSTVGSFYLRLGLVEHVAIHYMVYWYSTRVKLGLQPGRFLTLGTRSQH